MIFKDYRKFKIEHETVCSQCIHWELCKEINIWSHQMDIICDNYKFGTSMGKQGCDQCLLRHTRYQPKEDPEYKPCFKCTFFKLAIGDK